MRGKVVFIHTVLCYDCWPEMLDTGEAEPFLSAPPAQGRNPGGNCTTPVVWRRSVKAKPTERKATARYAFRSDHWKESTDPNDYSSSYPYPFIVWIQKLQRGWWSWHRLPWLLVSCPAVLVLKLHQRILRTLDSSYGIGLRSVLPSFWLLCCFFLLMGLSSAHRRMIGL